MSKTNKPNTLFKISNNVNINSIINQTGGKGIMSKKLNDINSSSNNSDSELSDDGIDVSESDDKNDISNPNDEILDDNDIIDDDEIAIDDTKNDELSSQDQNEDNDDFENESVKKDNDDYINNEEILDDKCYSKYVVDDDIDFDELFGDEKLNIKNSRLTKPILTKYEKVRLLTDRTKQLAQGAKPMLKNTAGLSSKEIALLELKNKIIPLIIERPVPNSGVERWRLSELEIPDM